MIENSVESLLERKASRRDFLRLTVPFLIWLAGCKPTDILRETPDVPRNVPERKLQPYDIVLTPDLNRDLAKVIWYALENGAAANLNQQDFYHCHLLVSRKVYKEKYKPGVYRGTLSRWINSVAKDYEGLLCHTQELTSEGLDPRKRNVIIWKGKEPYILPVKKDRQPISPHDLNESGFDVAGLLGLTFYPDPRGEIVLPDRRRVNVIIEHPEIYTIHHSPRDMEIDLP